MGYEYDETPLINLLEAVHDRDSFLAFVQALGDDHADEEAKEALEPSPPFSPGWNEWENGRIADFLWAAVRYAQDHGDRPTGLPREPSWKAFAEFLYGGKIYE